MTQFNINGETYICENEQEFVRELRKAGCEKEIQIREAWHINSETIRIIAEQGI